MILKNALMLKNYLQKFDTEIADYGAEFLKQIFRQKLGAAPLLLLTMPSK